MKIRFTILFLFLAGYGKAQTTTSMYRQNLSRKVTLSVRQKPISDVLDMISKAGDFYFSYSGVLFNRDSLVNVNVKEMPVRDVIDQLFKGKVDYKENSEYIILRYAVNHLTIVAENITTADNLYMISGYVVDTKTGKKVKQASVYEKRLLQSDLTNNEGFFSLRFRGEDAAVILTASKETYRDTSLIFLASVDIKPQTYADPDREKGTFLSDKVASLGIGKFLTSSKLRIQSLNIPSFFSNTPFQASLVPGISSHGMMSPNVVNTASLNIVGGYSAGVNGAEIAGVFNLTKGDVHKFQTAGVFNIIGGSVLGVQIAGVTNLVEGRLRGVQIAGVFNRVSETAIGVQIAGVMNTNKGNTTGMQISGIINSVRGNYKGTQIGLINNGEKDFRGMQIGLLNTAKNFHGFRIGLLNLADSTAGTSIGLLNLSKNGYAKISVFANDLANANIAFKSGNANLYTIFTGGQNFSDTAKVATYGAGLGHDFVFSNRVSIAAEGIVQYVYLGTMDYSNILMKAQTNLQIGIGAGFSIFGGPSYSYYNSDAPAGSSSKNYKKTIVPAKHQNFSGNNQGWLGWNAGVTLGF
jgi:hypothetical protein